MPGHCTVQSALIAQQHCRWQAADDEDDDAAGEYVMKAPSVVENSRLSGLCHATTTTTTNPSVLSAVPAAATYRPCGDQLLQLQLPLFLLLLCRRRQLSALSSFLLSYFGAAVALTHTHSLSPALDSVTPRRRRSFATYSSSKPVRRSQRTTVAARANSFSPNNYQQFYQK